MLLLHFFNIKMGVFRKQNNFSLFFSPNKKKMILLQNSPKRHLVDRGSIRNLKPATLLY